MADKTMDELKYGTRSQLPNEIPPGETPGEVPDETRIEKFSLSELAGLRCELMQAGIDSWQAADVVSAFLVDRGYGVDTFAMRKAVTSLEPFRTSIEAMDAMQAVLETVAFVM